MRWVVGSGKIYFWDDIWAGNTTLRSYCLDDRGNPLTLVSDFISEGAWDLPKIQLLHAQAGLPQQVIDCILDTPIINGEPDIPRWTLSRLGDFSIASTWETVRRQRPQIPDLEIVWKAGLTYSIAIFIWRLLSNRIPVDTKLQWRKIDLASKCQCCYFRPDVESAQHLFIQGAGASRVWREFDDWFEGSSPPIRPNDSIPDRLEVWVRRSQQMSKKHLSRLVPYLILWFLWAERNRSRHQETQFKPHNVVWQVQMYIRNSISNGSIKRKHCTGVKLNFDAPAHPENCPPLALAMSVKWIPPGQSWIKLNTDGAFVATTGRAGGGGIIRDFSGKMLAAFTTPLEAQSALEAELLAIHLGLTLAREFEMPIWVESDAAQAISLVNGSSWGPAHVFRAMGRLALHKRRGNFRISFIHREGNKAADFLAKMGLEKEEFHRMDAQTAPRMLKAIVRMEGMGIPNIRTREDEPG